MKNGGVYYTDQNGNQVQAGTYVQIDVDLPPGVADALHQAGVMADAGVKAAMILTAPEYLAAGGAVGVVELAGGAAPALGGESGLDLVQGSRTLNQMVSSGQRQLLRDFFQTGKLPEGLTERSLQVYKEIAQRAIAAGKDELGVQAQRLQMIANALK